MKKSEWKKRFKQRLIERGGATLEMAEDEYQGGIKDHDYEERPEISADECMSYWVD